MQPVAPMRSLLLWFLAVAATAFAAELTPTFNAVLTMGGQHRFVLTTAAGASSKWLELGEAFEEHTLKDFDAKTNELILEKEGVTRKIALVHAAIGEGGASAAPATPATLADAEAMLQAMRFDEMMAKMAAQQKEAMRPIFEQQASRMRIPEDQREKFAELQAKIMDETLGVMAGTEMREAIAQLYSEVFSKEELAAMSSFHSTPAGQALIDKQPLVQQRMMEIMMRRMSEIGPRMQALTEQFRPKKPESAPDAAK